MANRENHYEAAFEAYLRERRIPYVAVDEAKRSRFGDGSIKSLDFIVSPRESHSWLVDVKGRRFPSGEQKQYWKNWSTRDDLVSLARWERLFGDKFGGLFVFAYNIVGDRSPVGRERLFTFRGALYAFVGVPLGRYAAQARPISPRWDTLAMPTLAFRQAAAPFEQYIQAPSIEAPSCDAQSIEAPYSSTEQPPQALAS
jgi:hypothetical protein